MKNNRSACTMAAATALAIELSKGKSLEEIILIRIFLRQVIETLHNIEEEIIVSSKFFDKIEKEIDVNGQKKCENK